MAKRGRKSTASLTVVQGSLGQRPPPPEDLTAEQAEVWRSVTSTKPATYFDAGTFPLLAAYCRSVISSQVLSRMIDAIDVAEATPVEVKQLDKLLAAGDRQTRMLLALSRTMRFTQQSRYSARTAASLVPASGMPTRRPWEWQEPDE